jgi:hypothetical protein
MARCRKCGEKLVGAAKFCVTCGAPVPDVPATLESVAFDPPPGRAIAPPTDPPKTKASVPTPEPAVPANRASNYGPPPPAPAPLQQSWSGQPPYGSAPPAYPQAPVPYPYPPQPQAYPPPQAYSPYAPPPGGYAPPFAAGGRVLVLWADGNRYPGVVQQVAPGQCLVVFPDGQQRWVEFQYLTPAR